MNAITFSASERAGWLEQIRWNAVHICEPLRPLTRKPNATGTLSEAAALYLREIVEAVHPRKCVEIGTFIGTSALVLAATGAKVCTCDKDNGAFQSGFVESGGGFISAFPKTGSTAMLTALAYRGGFTADLWFFDGRIQDEDLPLIQKLSSAGAVYAFDDYEGREKGVINVDKLWPHLPGRYRLTKPPETVLGAHGTTTIAVLWP